MLTQRLCDMMTVKVPPQIRDEVMKIARRREVGMSEVVRNYVYEGLRRDGVTC